MFNGSLIVLPLLYYQTFCLKSEHILTIHSILQEVQPSDLGKQPALYRPCSGSPEPPSPTLRARICRARGLCPHGLGHALVTKTPKVLTKWPELFARIGASLGGSFVLCGHLRVRTYSIFCCGRNWTREVKWGLGSWLGLYSCMALLRKPTIL